jgi:hypothetical protein
VAKNKILTFFQNLFGTSRENMYKLPKEDEFIYEYLLKNKYNKEAIYAIKDRIYQLKDETKKSVLIKIIENVEDYSFLENIIKEEYSSLLLGAKMAFDYNNKKMLNDTTKIYWTKNKQTNSHQNKKIRLIENKKESPILHYASVLKVGDVDFFIDSIARKPQKDGYKKSVRVICHDDRADKGMQSDSTGCSVFPIKIARILSFLPNDILLACVSEEKYIDRNDNKEYKQKIFDFGKLERYADENNQKLGNKYEETKKMTKAILPHILSFSQISKYKENICKKFDINIDELENREFIKITNQNNLNENKQKKITTLKDLLKKYQQSYKKNDVEKLINGRVESHRLKSTQRMAY